MSDSVAVHVMIKGRVQGVAFRVSTKSAAATLYVCGWVRNTDDGCVEAFFEGPKPRVDAMLNWCKEGPSMAVVESVDILWEGDAVGCSEFSIRY